MKPLCELPPNAYTPMEKSVNGAARRAVSVKVADAAPPPLTMPVSVTLESVDLMVTTELTMFADLRTLVDRQPRDRI